MSLIVVVNGVYFFIPWMPKAVHSPSHPCIYTLMAAPLPPTFYQSQCGVQWIAHGHFNTCRIEPAIFQSEVNRLTVAPQLLNLSFLLVEISILLEIHNHLLSFLCLHGDGLLGTTLQSCPKVFCSPSPHFDALHHCSIIRTFLQVAGFRVELKVR